MSTVLVVDDEADILFLIRMALERGGYQVTEAFDGREALDRLNDASPDLVVTDLMMPVMNGLELIRTLRSNPSTAAIPILMVSANPNGSAGADAILAKPFRQDELLALVRDLIAGGDRRGTA